MKKKNRVIPVLLPVLVCGIAAGIYSCIFVFGDDTDAPKITMEYDTVEVSVKADESELFAGVAASDGRDGDVSESLLIEKISSISEEGTATVTYAAFDSSGNVAKATRTVKYTDYEAPKFGQKGSLTFTANSSPDILGRMSAHDLIDGDISERIKGTLISDTVSINYKGVHQIEFRVTNSMGDTEYIVLPVEIYESGTYNAALELSEYLIYLKKGEKFDPEEYLRNIVIGNMRYEILLQEAEETEENEENEISAEDFDIEIRNEVINTVPGVYSVAYTVTFEGRYVGYARLNVVVEE